MKKKRFQYLAALLSVLLLAQMTVFSVLAADEAADEAKQYKGPLTQVQEGLSETITYLTEHLLSLMPDDHTSNLLDYTDTAIEYNTALDPSILSEMEENYTDIMIFGVDARIESGTTSMDAGTNGDLALLAHVNNATGEVTLVSFYRDLYLDYNGRYRKLTDIYGAYGARGAISAINLNFDLHIQRFVTVNWLSAAEIIDQLGGVWVDVPEEMMGSINGYITETVNETGRGTYQLAGAGYQHLDGIETVAYCRIRKATCPGYDYGDYGRTQRQREIVTQLLGQVKTLDLVSLGNILNLLISGIYTNLDTAELFELMQRIYSYQVVNSSGFPFEKTSPDNSAVVAIDTASNTMALHQLLYGTEDGYTLSERAQSYANGIASQFGL